MADVFDTSSQDLITSRRLAASSMPSTPRSTQVTEETPLKHRDKKDQTRTEARRFYSVAEVARMIGTSDMTLYRAIRAGEFPAVRIRGRLIVPAKALDASGGRATWAR